MARGRLISRTLGSSRKYAALHQTAGRLAEFAQSLYPLLVSCSDDFGRQAGDAFTVKLVVFPSSPRKETDFALALASLASVELIRWYEAEGGQVVEITDFDEHQPGLSRRTKSKFPPSPVNITAIHSEENGTEPKRTEPKGTALRERFERFWDVYPKKVGKDAAWVEFQKRSPGDDLTDEMIAVVQQQRASEQWRKEGGQYIPNPRTWLHQGRWQDEVPPAQRSAKAGPAYDDGYDWFAECKRVHQGACELNRHRHMSRMETEKAS